MNQFERGITAPEKALQALQVWAWKEGDWTGKAWWTPIPWDYLRWSLGESYGKRLLVIGCGDGRRELLCAEGIGWRCFAFDINETLVQKAAEPRKNSHLPFARRTSFFAGDLFTLPLRLKEDFGAVLMVGVATSLIGRNLDRALNQISPRIRSQGYLVISDFMISFDQPAIEGLTGKKGQRYLRDAAAIETVLGSTPQEVSDQFSGIIVIRPRSLPWRKALDLTAVQVAQAIKEGNFERLAQHRSLSAFQTSLTRAGFRIVEHKERLVYPEVIEEGGKKRVEDDALINIQILAQKEPSLEP